MTDLTDIILEAIESVHDMDVTLEDYAKAAAEAVKGAIGWQPIETAPKDDTYVLAVRDEIGHRAACVIFFDEEFGWCGRTTRDEALSVKFPPTHWMPLPEPPAAMGVTE